MTTLTLFGVTLVVAALASELAHRSVLSTAVLFLAVGYAAGRAGWLDHLAAGSSVRALATAALVAVLFTDGMHAGLSDLRGAWKLPGRLLLFGLPLTLGMTAVAARVVVGLSWTASFLTAAALSPTDPVLAAAIVGRHEVPGRIRHLLNVESGLNDGLALPVVIVLIAVSHSTHPHLARVALELLTGIAIGIAIPIAIHLLRRIPILKSNDRYQPLLGLGVGLTVYGAAASAGANPFLAAFAAGSCIATIAPTFREGFGEFGAQVTEVVKLLALLGFGALTATRPLTDGWRGWAMALVALLVARPIAVYLSLIGTGVHGRELVTVAWFGPKAFATVIYALLILDADINHGREIYSVIAAVTVVSMVLHASTDVLVARWFEVDTVARGPLEGAS